MAWRESIDIPPVKHGAPIPMAARAGNILYTSGIMGANPDTGDIPTSVEEQAVNCFRNLQKVLDLGGAKASDVVRVSVLLKSGDSRAAVNPPWLEMFPDEHSRPARHATIVETLVYDIQIEAVAVIEGA